MQSHHDDKGTADMTPTLLTSHPAALPRRPAPAAAAAPIARRDTVDDCANAPVFADDANVIEAWARQASFASGFGGGLAEVESAPAAAAPSHRPLDRLQQALRRLMQGLNRWLAEQRADLRARETARQLAELDDRQLRDIGLSRSEILSAALESERTVAQYSARVHAQRAG